MGESYGGWTMSRYGCETEARLSGWLVGAQCVCWCRESWMTKSCCLAATSLCASLKDESLVPNINPGPTPSSWGSPMCKFDTEHNRSALLGPAGGRVRRARPGTQTRRQQHARPGGQPDRTHQGQRQPRTARGSDRRRLTRCGQPAAPSIVCVI